MANWCANVHVAIQRLLAIPEPNRTEEETNLWNSLAEFIDFQAYEESRPIKTVRRGVVLSAWPKDWQVQWEDDDSVECVSVVVVPEDFVRLHEGDHFEATADVHPIDGTLMYVHEVRPVEPYEDLLPEDAEAYWESLRQTEDLAESGHDWTQP